MPPSSAVLQQLLMRRQRAQIDAAGASVGAAVLYLKAAFADPVLYDNAGTRRGSDIDVLVHPARFEAFCAVLVGMGYRPFALDDRRATMAAARERTLFPPGRAGLAVDVHRALDDPPWCHVDTAALFNRARAYESPDGPVWSLSPDDQVLHAVLHHAAHCFSLDGRHADDIPRLGLRFPIDWPTVFDRIADAGLRVACMLLTERWRPQGLAIPPEPWAHHPGVRARLRLARHWVTTTPVMHRVDIAPRPEALLLRPLLSDAPMALPRFLARYPVDRLRDALAR